MGMRTRNVSALVAMFAVVAACLVLLSLRVGGEWVTVVLACGVILVSSAIAAMLTATSQSLRGNRRRSERHYMALTVVSVLLGTSIGAMVVLVIVTEPLELIKTALGGVIVLSGSGVSAVLSMSRADAAGHKADAAGREAASARDSAEQARESADGADRRASEARDEARRASGGPG